MAQRPTAELKVPSQDPKKKDEDEDKKTPEKNAGPSKANGDKKEELVCQMSAINTLMY